MKSIQTILRTLAVLLCLNALANAAVAPAWNPAQGIYIQRIGLIYDSEPTTGTLFYTRYGNVSDRVKSVEFYYDGQGYFELRNKDTICTTGGADGIIHHPDGDLLVAGQGKYLYKVSKAGGANCVVKTVECAGCTAENYHLMMDPSNEYVWGLGIPGPLIQYPTTNATPGRLANGTRKLIDNSNTRELTTLAWDNQGTTFYTRSEYSGNDGEFGIIDMSTYQTTKLFDVPKGAHGMTYDEYSKKIFIFGSSHIIQIDPISREILVDLDMNQIGFSGISWPNDVKEWRFDQGTVDGKGHLLVASNSGHLVFIDYTSNINRRIDNNVLIHAQFLDHWLDDVAPLSGVGSPRTYTSANSGGGSSSSRVYSSSSYAVVVSSSSTGTGVSDGSGGSSSSSTGTGVSDGSGGSSSSGTGTGVSDGSGGSSSSGTGTGVSDGSGGSSSSGTGSGVSDGSGGSSSSGTGSGVSDGSGGSSSSGTGSGVSDGSGGSSSSGTGSGVSDGSGGSSSSGTGSGVSDGSGGSSSSGTGGGLNDAPWCIADPNAAGCKGDNTYGGLDDGYELGDDDDYDTYPSDDARTKGDSSVTVAVELIPVNPDAVLTGNEVVINGNKYLPGTSGGDPIAGYTPTYNKELPRDSVPVGKVIEMQLDMAKLTDYLDLQPGDKITVTGSDGLLFVDPSAPATPADQIQLTGGKVWVTSDSVVSGGKIYITGPDGKTVVYDGVTFYDPIPKAVIALLKDPDGDAIRDAIEVVLVDTVPAGYSVSSVQVVVKGVTSTANLAVVAGERIEVDVSNINFDPLDPLGPDDVVRITYTDEQGVNFVRTVPLKLASGHVINRALVLHNPDGTDSLFVEFNFNVVPTDLALGDMLVLVNAFGGDAGTILVDRMRLPAKNLVLFDGVTAGCVSGKCAQVVWKGSFKDSIQLSQLAVFKNMPYITSEEYDRQVPIEVVTRLPATEYADYYDNDGDGVMDSVVVQLSAPTTAADVEMLYFAFPWYSATNRLIQLQPQPTDLVLDPTNPSRIGWKVQSNVTLRSGLTSIPPTLPLVELYVNYPVLGNTFQEERHFIAKDKMAPAIVDARLRYGSAVDSLEVKFSETVVYKDIGLDLFDYIHGKDTLHLQARNILWSEDGYTAWVLLPDGADRVVPGDSLMLVTGKPGKVVVDVLGNMPGRNASPLLIQGSLTHLVETVDMGTFDPSSTELREANSVTISYVPGDMRTKDLREKGELGHIIELGSRFMPQLIKGSATDDNTPLPTDIDPSKVSIALQVQYFDHVGQYVTDTTIVIPCLNPKFGGNCLDTDQKLFVNWNYKSKGGAFVGSGVYLVQFKLLVSYEKTTIKEEMLDKWGVRRKSK